MIGWIKFGLLLCFYATTAVDGNKTGGVSSVEKILLNQQQQIDELTKSVRQLSITVLRQKDEISSLKRQCRNDKKKIGSSKDEGDSADHLLTFRGVNSHGGIGFYAYLSHNEIIGNHKVMVFNVIETNYGGGYNGHSGLFTAPVAGLYGFSCSLSPSAAGIGIMHMVLNEKTIATIFVDSDSDNWDVGASATTAVVFLQQGDDVFIRSSSEVSVSSIEGSHFAQSSFTGWLISA